MSLRWKTLSILGTALAVWIGVLYTTVRVPVSRDAAVREREAARHDVGRVRNALDADLDGLKRLAVDWARWDDAYAFVLDHNQRFVKSNLTDALLLDLDLSFFVFADLSGRVVYARVAAAEGRPQRAWPEPLRRHLTPNRLLFSSPKARTPRTGILLLPDAPVLVVACPVLDSDDVGPARGTLIVGRALDASAIAELSQRTQLGLQVAQSDQRPLPGAFAGAAASLSPGSPPLVQPLSETTIAAFAPLPDIYGQAALYVRVTAQRALHQQTGSLLWRLLLSMSILGVAAGLTVLFALDRLVLLPLARLSAGVTGLGRRGGMSGRLEVCGRDEIAAVAAEVNRMLAELERAQQELRRSEEMHRLAIEAAEAVPYARTYDPDAYNFVGAGIARLTGYLPEEFTPALWAGMTEEVVPHGDLEGMPDAEQYVLQTPGTVWRADYRVRTRAGDEKWILNAAAHQRDGSERAVASRGVLQDITARKQVESELRESRARLQSLASRLESAREEERTRLAREVHDELGQVLTGLRISASRLLEGAAASDTGLAEDAKVMSEMLDGAIESVKRIATELRPGILDDLGLAAALEWLGEEAERRLGISCRVRVEPAEIHVDPELTTAVFRLCQECLTNVARHAEATEVQVTLRQTDRELSLEVVDDGKGISEAQLASPQSLGLIGMRERVTSRGGCLNIAGPSGQGTRVAATIPLR
jgi:signal transduction histidine kinase